MKTNSKTLDQEIIASAAQSPETTSEIDYKKKYNEAIHFIEMTEALTYDDATRRRIRDYLIREKIWD